MSCETPPGFRPHPLQGKTRWLRRAAEYDVVAKSGSEFCDCGLQFADAFLEVWQTSKSGGIAEPQFVVDGGRAGADLVGLDVAGEAGGGCDNDIVADRQVARRGGLAGEDAVVADF